MSPRGDGRTFQRRGIWWIAYYGPDPRRPGRRKEHRESSKSTDPRAAGVLLRNRLAAVRGDRFVAPEQERERVGTLLDAYVRHRQLEGRWKSPRDAESQVKRTRDHFGRFRVSEITTPALKTWAKARLDEGAARATVKQWLATLRAAMRLAHREGQIGRLPYFPTIQVRNARRGFFERDEFEAVVKHLAEPWDDIVRFGYLVGWRLGEIVALRWEWVDRRAGVILLPDSKSGEPRSVPLTEEDSGGRRRHNDVGALIERRWAARKVGVTVVPLVFHWGGHEIHTFLKRWRAACIAAGFYRMESVKGQPVKRATKLFHDLRRTAVRDMVRAGVPETVAMSISGHKTRHVFDRYDITSLRDQEAAISRTSAYRAGQTSNVTDIREASK